MQYVTQFFSNRIMLIAIASYFAAQLIKAVIAAIHHEKLSFHIFFTTGGMPSSHSSTVCSLATACGIEYCFDSSYFAITFILAIIVMTDAAGVRRAVGQHANIINRILDDIAENDTDRLLNHDLKELIGHTPTQVFCGAVLGIFLAVVLMAL